MHLAARISFEFVKGRQAHEALGEEWEREVEVVVSTLPLFWAIFLKESPPVTKVLCRRPALQPSRSR